MLSPATLTTTEAVIPRICDRLDTPPNVASAASTVLAVTERQVDEEGIELSSEERKDDYLARLAAASERAPYGKRSGASASKAGRVFSGA